MDDTFVNEVPKKEIMFFKLNGAPQCHAPELALELDRAKREVSLGHATVFVLASLTLHELLRGYCGSSRNVLLACASPSNPLLSSATSPIASPLAAELKLDATYLPFRTCTHACSAFCCPSL